MRQVLRCALAAGLVSVVALGRAAEPVDLTGTEADIAALKVVYLACDRAASQRQLDFGEAAECSVASERLLQHGFGGDFDRLLAWWRSAKLADAALPDAALELAQR
jgi:hypothetical protein